MAMKKIIKNSNKELYYGREKINGIKEENDNSPWLIDDGGEG